MGLRLLLMTVLLIGGCNSSQIVGVQLGEGYKDAHYKKILVIGVSRRIDLRRNYEDEFVTQLKARGVDAIPGYQFLPEGAEVDRMTLEQAIQKSGAQAALLTRLMRVKEETAASASMGPEFTPGMWGSYDQAWNGFYEPPQSGGQFNPQPQPYTGSVVVVETRLIDARTGDTAWTARTHTFNPGEGMEELPGLVKVLLDGLVKDGLIS